MKLRKKNKSDRVPPKKKVKKEQENFMEAYCHFMYKYFGRKMLKDRRFKFFFYNRFYNIRYEGILKKANLRLIPEEYFLSIFLTLLFILLAVFGLSILYFFINPLITVFIFYGGIFSIAVVGIFLYNYPVVLTSSRGAEIDAAIPYLLPYMKILAKELSLSKILEIIVDFLIYKEIRVEFEKIKYYSNVLGYDIHSSIREAMFSCPSRQLSDMMNDLVTISNSGGNIYNYLDRKLENLNQEIDAIEKKNIDTLLIYSQIYVVMLLIAPLFYTIMSTILNLVDFSSAGSSSSATAGGTAFSIFAMLVFLPLVYVGFMMLVYYSKPLYSRLNAMEDESKN